MAATNPANAAATTRNDLPDLRDPSPLARQRAVDRVIGDGLMEAERLIADARRFHRAGRQRSTLSALRSLSAELDETGGLLFRAYVAETTGELGDTPSPQFDTATRTAPADRRSTATTQEVGYL